MNWNWIDLSCALGGLVLLASLYASLVACEFSLVKIRYSASDNELMERLRKTAGIAKLLDRADKAGRNLRFLRTITAMAFAALAVLLLEPLLLGWVGGDRLPRIVSGLLAFGVLVVVFYPLFDLLPRAFAIRAPEPALKRSWWVLSLVSGLAMPLLLPLRFLKSRLFAGAGLDPEDDLDPLDVEVQIRALGEDETLLTPVVRKIINKALQFNRLVVYDILLPRNQVRFLDLNDTLEENLALARETGHTRFPLCEDDLDRCLGIIHIKDVFRHPGDPKKLNLLHIKRDISSLRLDLPLEDALQRLLRQRAHMALVQDEFGGTLGLVTLERILEELVGEIQDEFDSEERLIKRKSHNTWQVAGLVPLHDFEEVVQLEMENADVSTFGGLITSELGRFPEPGEKLMLLNRLEVSIDEVEETRIKWASVVKLPEPEPDSESSTKSAEAS